MDYAKITEDISHQVRDAEFEATRFIFEDPHQPWTTRSRVRIERELEPELHGITDTDL